MSHLSRPRTIFFSHYVLSSFVGPTSLAYMDRVQVGLFEVGEFSSGVHCTLTPVIKSVTS